MSSKTTIYLIYYMLCIPFMKQRFWIQIIHKMGHFLLSTDLFLALNGSMLDRNCYRFLIFATDFSIPFIIVYVS